MMMIKSGQYYYIYIQEAVASWNNKDPKDQWNKNKKHTHHNSTKTAKNESPKVNNVSSCWGSGIASTR